MQNFTAQTQALTEYGADTAGAIARFLDDTALYWECIHTFLDDDAFCVLQQAAEAAATGVFEAAHALKGVAANLGLTPMYGTLCTLVELLRADAAASPAQACRAVLAERERLVRLLAAFPKEQ